MLRTSYVFLSSFEVKKSGALKLAQVREVGLPGAYRRRGCAYLFNNPRAFREVAAFGNNSLR